MSDPTALKMPPTLRQIHHTIPAGPGFRRRASRQIAPVSLALGAARREAVHIDKFPRGCNAVEHVGSSRRRCGTIQVYGRGPSDRT
jgi:hypothetical protein